MQKVKVQDTRTMNNLRHSRQKKFLESFLILSNKCVGLTYSDAQPLTEQAEQAGSDRRVA